jgi:peptidoglycan hydrolase-like protein with peptidoglycan-binding domain
MLWDAAHGQYPSYVNAPAKVVKPYSTPVAVTDANTGGGITPKLAPSTKQNLASKTAMAADMAVGKQPAKAAGPTITKPTSTSGTGSTSTGNAQMAALQQQLSSLGFNPGKVDGIYGPNTRAAIIAFQRASGLTPDGIVGPQTLAALQGRMAPAPAPNGGGGTPPAPTSPPAGNTNTENTPAPTGPPTTEIDPMQQQIYDLLQQIQNSMNTPFTYDPATDPAYQAALAQTNKNVEQGQNNAAEWLNERGILTSSITGDEMANVFNQGQEQLNALIPGFQDAAYNRYQGGINNMMNLLGLTQSQYSLDQEKQFKEAELTGYYKNGKTLAYQEIEWNRDYKEKAMNIEYESMQVDKALNMLNTMGQVTPEVSQILGLPVGMETAAVRQAALDRAQQLKLQRESIAASVKARKASEKAQNKELEFNNLFKVWQATGKAPSGLEAYGVKPGTTFTKSSEELLADLQVEQAKSDAAAKKTQDAAINSYIKQGYGQSESVFLMELTTQYNGRDTALAAVNSMSDQEAMTNSGLTRDRMRQLIDEQFPISKSSSSNWFNNVTGSINNWFHNNYGNDGLWWTFGR